MQKTFSIIFAGTPEFAVPSLEALVADPAFTVSRVLTQSDKPVGRKQVLTAPPVKQCAEKHGIPVLQPEKANKDLSLDELSCDFLVTVAYGQILSEKLLSLPAIAPVNVHASLLPKWRGASPMQHTLLAGETETGITIQIMSKGVDEGPILSQCTTPIDARETLETLHDKLAVLGATLLTDTLKNPLNPQDQNEANATHCTKLTRKDGEVDPMTMKAEEIDRRVRALVPWPGVLCGIRGTPLKLLETSLEPQKDAYELPCAERTTLYVRILQPSGKKPMSGAAWARGHLE